MSDIKTEIDNYNKYAKEIPLIDLDNAYLCYELMYVIDLVFSKFDIEYSLTFGSLLGALRHGGLIPWDDDIDVMTIHPDDKKLWTEEVLNEFNKYGYNCFAECASRKWDCKGENINHIYKETNLGSSENLTNKYFRITTRRVANNHWTQYNGGESFRHPQCTLGDTFPYKYNEEKKHWKPSWSAYTKDDLDALTKDEIWPLKRIKFGSFEVSAINKAEEYCIRCFGETCFDEVYWRSGHKPSLFNKRRQYYRKYVNARSDEFRNLKVPCLFDPSEKTT